MSSTEAWLRFARLEIPARRALALLEAFGSPEAVLQAGRSDLEDVPGLALKTIERILEGVPDSDVRKDAQAMERCGASMLTILDPAYPPLLRQIADPPPVLFVKTRIASLWRWWAPGTHRTTA